MKIAILPTVWSL